MAMIGKDKKLVQKISQLRSLDGASGTDELLNVHSRLMKGRTAFESVMTGTLVSAMNISNLDLAVSDRVDELKQISHNLADTANELNNISAETANITNKGVASTITKDNYKLYNELISTAATGDNTNYATTVTNVTWED